MENRDTAESKVPWGLVGSKAKPDVPFPQAPAVLQVLWNQEVPKASEVISVQRVIPVKWDCRVSRKIPVQSDQEVTRDQSVLRAIPVQWDLLDRRASAVKKGNSVPPANRGLPECRGLRANWILRVFRETKVVPDLKENKETPGLKAKRARKGIPARRAIPVPMGLRAKKAKRATPEKLQRLQLSRILLSAIN